MRILFFAPLLFVFLIVHLNGDAQALIQKSIGATTPLAWGDYDNDGDFDLLQHDGTALRILKNNLVGTTATFVDAGITLANVNPTSVGWIDHNNDGFLDIYYVNAGNLSIWINQPGGSFLPATVSVGGESISIIADWGDIDDDGDQDFIGGGLILKNLGNNRFEVSQRLGSTGRTEFFDHDYDGDLDFHSKNFLYKNKGDGVFELSESLIINGANEVYGDLMFFGVDHAGDNQFAFYYRYNYTINAYYDIRDFVICGNSDDNTTIEYLKIADFDNDGQNDVLVRENSTINLYSSSSVTGTGNCNNIIASLSVASGRTEAADFDKDGDLDAFIGNSVFENKAVTANAAPSIPSTLSSAVEETTSTESSVTLSWVTATDDKTPAKALSYNVIVKRGPYVVFTDGIGAGGNQALVQRGNSGFKTSLKLRNLPRANYTWTVQSVDAALKTSALAPEKPFTIVNGPDLVTPLTISSQYSATYDETGDRFLLTYLKNGDVMGQWADGKTVQPTGSEFKINTTGSATSHIVGYNPVKNEFMVSWLEVNGNTKKIYAKNLVAAGGNLHAEKVIHSITDTLKVFLGGDKIAVDPSSGKYFIPFFQNRTDLTRPEINYRDEPPSTYYPNSVLDVYGIKVSATGTTITGETPKLLQSKDVPGPFKAFQNRNYFIQSAVGFDSKRKFYSITWNFMGERLTTYGQGSSGEITSVLYTDRLYLIVVDANLALKSENMVSDNGGRSHSLLYNSISDQFLFVWSYWSESSNGSGSDDYSFEVFQRLFTLQNNGTVVFKNGETKVSKLANIIDYGSGLPSLSWSKKRNEYLITWTKGNASGQYGVLSEGDLFYRRVNPFGNFNDGDSKFLLSTPGNETIIRNNSNQGHFLLGWKSGTQNKLTIFHLPKGPIPSVKSVTPDKAAAGAKVIVKATGMGNTPTLTKVYFSDEDKNEAVVDAAFPDPNDSTKIQVTVPSGLGRNKVMVRVKYDDQPSTDNVLFENVDITSVTSVAPLVGSPGEVITIKGVNFPTAKQDLTVMFGSTPAQVTDIEDGNSSTEIKVKVPQAAARGDNQPVGVVIQGILNNYAGGAFRVIRKPVITNVDDLTPQIEDYTSCKIIQVNGSNFSSNIDDLKIKIGIFEVTKEDVLSATDGTITMKIPLGVEGDGLHVTVSALDDGTGESPDTHNFVLGSKVELIKYANVDLPENHAGEFKLKEGDDENLALRVYNECSVDEIRFWTKGISQGDSEWKSVTLTGMENNTIEHKITDANVTADPLGLDAYYEVVDKSDSIRYSDKFRIFPDYEGTTVTAPIPSLTFGGDISDYNIVSIPSVLSPNKINTVFKSILDIYGYDKSKWRIFHYKNENATGANAEYVEYLDGLDDIDAGKGYWIIVRNEQEILFDLGNTPYTDGGPFEITLNNGWNQIGNPYNFDISWEDVKKGVAPEDLENIESYKTFEGGSFVTPDRIEKFRGGFVRYNGTAPLTLSIPFTQNPSGGRIKGEENKFSSTLDEKEWRIAIDLSAGELNNKINSFGMHPKASDEIDQRDEHALPAFVQSLDLSFPESLSTSIVTTDDNHTWDFEVRNTTDSKEVSLRWDNSSFGDNDRELFLHDVAAERLIDMRKENHYTFTYREGNNFKILFGDKSYIEKMAKPSDVVLSDAYPNPMQASTRIPFTITKDNTHVHLAIYSLQGQELQTLVNDDLAAGFYEFDWDGKGPSGADVNSSVVIYRLQTSERGSGVKSHFKKLVIAP